MFHLEIFTCSINDDSMNAKIKSQKLYIKLFCYHQFLTTKSSTAEKNNAQLIQYFINLPRSLNASMKVTWKMVMTSRNWSMLTSRPIWKSQSSCTRPASLGAKDLSSWFTKRFSKQRNFTWEEWRSLTPVGSPRSARPSAISHHLFQTRNLDTTLTG